jgi:hypothetical protein
MSYLAACSSVLASFFIMFVPASGLVSKLEFFLEYLVDMFELCTVERPRQMQDRMVHRMYDIQELVWQNVCITCGASVLTETMTPNYGNELVILWNTYHVLFLKCCSGFVWEMHLSILS